MDKIGGTLCYSPEKCCKIKLATMVLHSMCFSHGLLTDFEMSDPTLDIVPPEPSENGLIMSEPIVSEFFDSLCCCILH